MFFNGFVLPWDENPPFLFFPTIWGEYMFGTFVPDIEQANPMVVYETFHPGRLYRHHPSCNRLTNHPS